MEKLLNVFDRTDLTKPSECMSLLELIEAEFGTLEVFKKLEANVQLNVDDINKGQSELLTFLSVATLSLSLIPHPVRKNRNIIQKLQRIIGKILSSLRKYAKSLNVDTFSITVGLSVSVTLTFRP